MKNNPLHYWQLRKINIRLVLFLSVRLSASEAVFVGLQQVT